MKIEDALLACRARRPYYAAAITALTPVEHEPVGTLGVDSSWRLYWSPKFMATVDDPETASSLIEHELGHLLRMHGSRQRICGAHPIVWNLVGDAEINDDLKGLPKDAVYPKSLGMPDHLTAEEYLSMLPPKPPPSKTCGGGSGAGRPIDGELPPPDGKSAGTPGLSEAEAERVMDRVANDIMADPGAGAGIKMWASARAPKPRKVSLRERLARSIRRGGGAYRIPSWSKPSRRVCGDGIIRIGNTAANTKVAVLLDCSGSMRSKEEKALSACLGLIRDVPHVSLFGVDGDKVQSLKPSLAGIKKANGGGDIYGEKAVKELALKFPHIVIITDGHEDWGKSSPANCCVDFVLVGSGEKPIWAS